MKAICLISQDPDVKEAAEYMDRMTKVYAERLGFLQKAVDDEQKKIKAEANRFWDELEDKLRKKGMLKDYNSKKQFLKMDKDIGALLICEKRSQEGGLSDLLNALNKL